MCPLCLPQTQKIQFRPSTPEELRAEAREKRSVVSARRHRDGADPPALPPSVAAAVALNAGSGARSSSPALAPGTGAAAALSLNRPLADNEMMSPGGKHRILRPSPLEALKEQEVRVEAKETKEREPGGLRVSPSAASTVSGGDLGSPLSLGGVAAGTDSPLSSPGPSQPGSGIGSPDKTIPNVVLQAKRGGNSAPPPARNRSHSVVAEALSPAAQAQLRQAQLQALQALQAQHEQKSKRHISPQPQRSDPGVISPRSRPLLRK